MKTVATVELPLFERMLPLLGGYLEAYASTDPWLKETYRFKKCVESTKGGRDGLLRRLLAVEADVYAFSCYVWNSGLVKSVLGDLCKSRPSARIVLGGPQVMQRAEKYLSPHTDAVVVCNGEGEIIFADYLRELTQPRPDLAQVPGISYVADGQIVTTAVRTRTPSLDEIPSPFLSGLFPDAYSCSVLETNRGCPFRCAFCYWGAATNDKVVRFSDERVRAEIEWLSKKDVLYWYIADANWGMTWRDVGLTRHIAECRRKHGGPRRLNFSSAKNSPERVFEIVKILRDADVLVNQPVSLQSLSDEALTLIDRQNIKRANYVKLQAQLDELKISSLTELIWPLPGETLASFKAGLEELCRAGNSMIVAYAHLLLPNTPLDKRRETFGLVTVSTEDGTTESELVIATRTAARADVEDGFMYYYAVHLLHNAYALRCLASYLDTARIASYQELFTEFAEFMRRSTTSPVTQYVVESSQGRVGVDTFAYGKVVHYALHEHRRTFVQLLYEFVSSRRYWSDERVRTAYELDRVLVPYVYASTPMDPAEPSARLSARRYGDRGYEVEVPGWLAEVMRHSHNQHVCDAGGGRYRIDHARGQLPLLTAQTLEHNSGTCFEALRTKTMVPKCTVTPAVREPAEHADRSRESVALNDAASR